MGDRFLSQLRGVCYLVWLNLKHYSLALWGVRLRLDPDYPNEARFRGDLIVDAVLEYRGYGLLVPWCVFLVRILPAAGLAVLGVAWALLASKRAEYYQTAYTFWHQAYREAPAKHRNRTRYAEELTSEIARRLKAGADYESPAVQSLIAETLRMQDLIVRGEIER